MPMFIYFGRVSINHFVVANKGMDKSKSKLINGIIILSVIHLISIWGIKSEAAMDFYFPYIAVDILLCFGFLVYYQQHWNMNGVLFLFFTFCAGFIIQAIGVNTVYIEKKVFFGGYPFGPFVYGSALGPKLWNTPLLIGINWLILIYCIGILLKNLSYSKVQKSLLGASMLVLYDIVLEPMAKRNEMWFWLTKKDPLSHYNPVPLQNYAGWFLFSFLMLIYFYNAKAKIRNPIAPAVFIIMFFFLVALHIF